jgi:hypothetical protein
MTNFVHHRRPQTSFTGPLVKKLPKTGRYLPKNNNGTGVALYRAEAFKPGSKGEGE